MAVKRGHRGTGVRVVIDGDEREPARFAGHAVHHETDFIDLAMLFEQILKIVLGGLKKDYLCTVSLCLDLEKLPTYRAVPVNRVSNHQRAMLT